MSKKRATPTLARSRTDPVCSCPLPITSRQLVHFAVFLHPNRLGLTRTRLLEIIDIEIVEPKKQPGARQMWTLAEDKALSALMEDKELDMDDRADAMAAQGFLQRSMNALELRWGRIKHRKLTPEEEQKMEAKERKLAAKKAKKNSGELVVALVSPKFWLLHGLTAMSVVYFRAGEEGGGEGARCGREPGEKEHR